MGILSDFFIAEPNSTPDYAGGESFSADDKLHFRGISTLQTAQFLAAIRNEEYSVALMNDFPLITPEEADEWTFSVPNEFTAAFASLDASSAEQLAAKLSEATKQELGWSADDFMPVVNGISAIARRAIENNKSLYLWNSL